MSAKDIEIRFIDKKTASSVVEKYHYSHKALVSSQLNFGVYYLGKIEGALMYGPPIDRYKLQPLVPPTKFYDFLELNRMAFSDNLPRNSESRAIAITLKLIKKHYPQIKWIVSFADGCQCGDGTIYRASGFLLTQISKNKTMRVTESGKVIAQHGLFRVKGYSKQNEVENAKILPGFQLRYIYFLDKGYQKFLTCPILPYSAIAEAGAKMYKGKKIGQE